MGKMFIAHFRPSLIQTTLSIQNVMLKMLTPSRKATFPEKPCTNPATHRKTDPDIADRECTVELQGLHDSNVNPS